MHRSLHTRARRAHDAIRAGRLRGDELLHKLLAVPFVDRDVWLDAALKIDTASDDLPDLPLGTVPYVPCGVDAIVRAVLDAPVRPHDVFVDLGAGLGRVAVLAHLLTGARAVGVEMQAPLVHGARVMARELGVAAHVRFDQGDATDARLDEGTVFFIFASFGASALARILAELERVARDKEIVLCAVGFDVHVPWLRARSSLSPEVALYDSAM